MKLAILLMCAFLSSASFAAPTTFLAAKEIADRNEKALTSDQLKALISSQGTVGGKAIAECFPSAQMPKTASFALVMKLDASGNVDETWLNGDSEGARCFRKRMAVEKLFVPPFAPFYTVFEMTLNRQ